jgi:hypothetical protein
MTPPFFIIDAEAKANFASPEDRQSTNQSLFSVTLPKSSGSSMGV